MMMEWQAGRELDAEIARKVFGHDAIYETSMDIPMRSMPSGTFMGLTTYEGARYRTPPYGGDVYPRVPEYSTDIAAAWQIVERIGGYFLLQHAIRTGPFGFGVMTWYCAFAAPRRFEATGDTAPLTICRAALLMPAPDSSAQGAPTP